jgi:predicted dehydrogenase
MSEPNAAIEPALRQAWPSPARPRPIVMIGAGGIAQSAHLPAYRDAGLEVVGLFDVRADAAQRAAAEFGVKRVFKTLESASSETGAVFDVTVPPAALLPVLEALPVGAAVLLQKPLGRDLGEARRIASLCQRRQLTAAVNFQLRFSPNMLALRDALERGLLGEPRDLELRVNVLTPWHLWDFLKGIPRHELLYHSIHYLDLVRSLLGDPRSVLCRVTRNPDLPEHSDTASATLLDYGPHLRVLVASHHAHDFGPRHMMSELKLEGTRGAALAKLGVNLDYPRGAADELELAAERGRAFEPVALRGSWFHHAFAGPMQNLQRYIAAEDDTLHTRVDDALRTMALVEACYVSSASPGTPLPDAF